MQENNQLEKPSYSIINKDSMLQLATELSQLIKEKKLSSNIQGKEFVNVEGWMLLDNFFPWMNAYYHINSRFIK